MSQGENIITGEQKPLGVRQLCFDSGMSDRSPDASGECRTSARTSLLDASHTDGPDPTD